MPNKHWTAKVEASLYIADIDSAPYEIDPEMTMPYTAPFESMVPWEHTIPMQVPSQLTV